MTEPYLTSTLQRLELPEPLVPDDVDLRGLRTMPLDVDALLASELLVLANDAELATALKLWSRCWQNSGRLSNDERVLAGYGCNGDRKKWAAVKRMAMRGFVLCNDGNWYHETISQFAIRAWDERLKYRAKRDVEAERLRLWRESKQPKNENEMALKRVSNDVRTHHEMPKKGREGKGREVKGTNLLKEQEQGQERRASEIQNSDVGLKPETLATMAMIQAGMVPTKCNPHDPRLRAAIAEGVTPELLASLVPNIPPNAAQPMAWVVAAARGQLADSKTRSASVSAGAVAAVTQNDHSKTMAEVLRGQ